MKKKKLFSAFKYILFLALGVLLLWYVTKGHDYEQFINEFKTANYYWIVLALFCGGISHIFRTLRWNLLIAHMGHKTAFSTTFYAIMIGYFVNMLVPRLGEVSRCVVLHKNKNIPFNSLFGTVVAERVFDMICLIIIGIAVVLLQFDFLKTFINSYIFTPVMSKLNNNFEILFLLFTAAMISMVAGYIYLRSRLKTKETTGFFYKLKKVLYGFMEGLKTIMFLPAKLTFLFHTLIIWIMYFFMTYLCFFSLSGTASLGVSAGFTILVMGSAGIVAPVPGGIGAYHFMVIATLVEVYSINPISATSFAYISHASQGVLIALLGALSFWGIFLQKKQLKKNV